MTSSGLNSWLDLALLSRVAPRNYLQSKSCHGPAQNFGGNLLILNSREALEL